MYSLCLRVYSFVHLHALREFVLGTRCSGNVWCIVQVVCVFFSNDPATTAFYSLSLRVAPPISVQPASRFGQHIGPYIRVDDVVVAER